jgi:NAD(P)-dependent dehydrogenase (short-subunit alcohol dehydrogenase family)
MDEPQGTVLMTGASGTVGTWLRDQLLPGRLPRLVTIGRTRPLRLRPDDHFERADLADPAATDLACRRIAIGPPVAALICAAGLDSRSALQDLDHAAFTRCMQVNCLAHLHLLRAAMASRPAAPTAPLAVVVISSDVIGQHTPATFVYAAAKAAAEEAFRHATADMPPPGAALLLVRLPDIGVPMRAATPGPPPPHRTPRSRPLPVLSTAVQAITGFLHQARAGVTVWHA